jgi:cell pole-organizing protein PopZ
MRQAGEPSVEEILESIKKVIARDTREEATRTHGGRAEAAQHRSVRERTIPAASSVAMPQLVSQTRAATEAKSPDESILELTDAQGNEALGSLAGDADSDSDHDDEGLDEGQGAAALDEESAKPLVAETAVASMRESLAALALLSQPGVAPQIVRSGETSLEGLTRDLLRPMLADWLERNLPAMVERLVAVEIARIAGKKG